MKTITNYTTPSGKVITEYEFVKDLGVTMQNNASFDLQINNIIEVGKQLSGWILRVFRNRSQQVMLTLWKSLVIPRIEHSSQLWSPQKVNSIQRIEHLQWSFVRKIDGILNLNYWQALKKLNLYSLQRRRERYQLIYVWKILENIVPNFSNISVYSHSRRGRLCKTPEVVNHLPKATQNLLYCSLKYTGPRLFNSLPKSVRDISNCDVNSFKNALDKYLKQVPDEPQLVGYTMMRRAETNSVIDMCGLMTSAVPQST